MSKGTSYFSVDAALGVVRLRLERHSGHVPQADEGAVGVGAEHYLLKLRGCREPSLGGYGYGEVEPGDGLLSQHACGRLAVLVFQGFLHVLHGEPEAGQAGRVDPYLHGVVAAAYVGHAPHSGYSAQQVEHVERGEVAKVDFVELGVVRGEADRHELAGGLLLYLDAVLHDFGRQARLGQLYAVLYLDGREVGV